MPGPDNKPVPAAAESYKLSEDGKHIHLHYTIQNGQMAIQ